MAKRIVWTEQAKADVRGIAQPIALQILKTLARYAQTGPPARKGYLKVTVTALAACPSTVSCTVTLPAPRRDLGSVTFTWSRPT